MLYLSRKICCIEFLNSVLIFPGLKITIRKPVKIIPDFRGSWSNRVISKVSGFSLWYIEKMIYWTSRDVVMVVARCSKERIRIYLSSYLATYLGS